MSPAAILTGSLLDELHARVTIATIQIVDLNDPRTTHGNVGSSSNMRTYHEPGSQQAAGAMRKAERALRKCAESLEAAYASAEIREKRSAEIDNIGDIETNAVEVAENPVRVDGYVQSGRGPYKISTRLAGIITSGSADWNTTSEV